MSTPTTVTVTTFDEAKDAYRDKNLRQALYDEGEVVMADVLVNLHGEEHRTRRRVENRAFRREAFEHYERNLFPDVIESTLEPCIAAGHTDLVPLGHQLMLNLAALAAGVDRPLGTAEETRRLHGYMMLFIEGATLAHSTLDKVERAGCIAGALAQWDEEFLQPAITRRRTLLARVEAGECEPDSLPRDVLTTLLRDEGRLGLGAEVVRREIAFFLLAGAHTSATAFVRSIDHILGWLDVHPEDAAKATGDPFFVQRCVHETVRLNPSSPVGMRWAVAPTVLRSGREIPVGAKVVIDLRAVNTDPQLFGPDAAEFNPMRELPPGVGPYGLSFGAGMHVCIGQDLAAGVVQTGEADPGTHLFGLVTAAVQRMFHAGVRRDPQNPPQRDTTTARPYWGSYPVLFRATAR
jgi:cytochrome P450